jgi:predicted  nucleic acid-binding Zn-ribbon protein
MPAKTHGDRLDRLEQIVEVLAEGQISLEKLVAELATETRRGFDQVAAQFREMSRQEAERSREIDERFRRTDERLEATNERIDKLVSGIGELVRISYPRNE